MSADFFDTNVLVYAYDSRTPRKQQKAQELLRQALAGELVTSTQALAEFCSTMLHKISPAANPKDVTSILDALLPVRVIAPDAGIVRRAIEVKARYGVHFYDGMIVASAERAGSGRIWSEDLNSGQNYFGIRIENPFV